MLNAYVGHGATSEGEPTGGSITAKEWGRARGLTGNHGVDSHSRDEARGEELQPSGSTRSASRARHPCPTAGYPAPPTRNHDVLMSLVEAHHVLEDEAKQQGQRE